MRLIKRKRRSHRKANSHDLKVVFRRRRAPLGGHDCGPLPLPKNASMQQRTVELPKLPTIPPQRHTYTGGLYAAADLPAVSNRVLAALRPGFRLKSSDPLFRDGTTWEDLEAQRLERLRQLQHLETAWPDGHGVNLGSDQSPKTLTFSTIDYREFAGSPDRKADPR